MTDTGPWPDLVSTALVGTSRRAVPPVPGLPGPDGGDPATALLDRAALAAAQRRAGQRPRRATLPRPAPAETAPLLHGPALTRLKAILSGKHASVLPEWLDLAAATGRRLPPEVLPALLDRARNNGRMRPALAGLGGARARWLAEHNPAWSFLLDTVEDTDAAFDTETWKTGTDGQRRAQFAALRRTDPAAARDLLAQAWPQERADQRRALLHLLEDGLGADDEPLLAAALRDRSHRVRVLAAALLARLPGSDTGRRLTGQLVAAVRVDTSGGGRRIVVDQPGDVDAEFTALLDTGGAAKKKTWSARMRTLLSHVPPGTWTGHLGDTPEQVLEAVEDLEVRRALTDAAVRYGDLAWARALLRSARTETFDLPEEEHRIPALLALLPHDERCAWILRWKDGELKASHRFSALLDVFRFPWNRQLSETMADLLIAGKRSAYTLYHLKQEASLRLDPALHERLAAECGDDPNLIDLADILKFRHDMRKELT